MSKKRTGRKLGPHTEETKQKIRNSHLGKVLSLEHKKKISESGKGRVVSASTRAKLSTSSTGRKHSEDTRKKFSLVRKGKPGKKHPPDCPCCERRRGKPHPSASAVRRANQNRKLPEPIRVERRRTTQRAATLHTRYGITIAEYDQLLVLQERVCAICKKPCSSGKRLAVDHDHKSGKTRGLLCRKCNRGVGLFDDNLELMQKAMDYLTRDHHPVPEKRWVVRPRVGRTQRADNLMYKYRVTVGLFDTLFEKQKGVCAICSRINPNGKRLSVDHDHTTGCIRGLLCNRCNLGLGHFDLGTLSHAIEYLGLTKC